MVGAADRMRRSVRAAIDATGASWRIASEEGGIDFRRARASGAPSQSAARSALRRSGAEPP